MRLRMFPMLLICIALALTANAQTARYEFRYHTYQESTAHLQELAKKYPQLAKLYSIGKSATGTKEIWCIEIGNQESGQAEDKPSTACRLHFLAQPFDQSVSRRRCAHSHSLWLWQDVRVPIEELRARQSGIIAWISQQGTCTPFRYPG